MAKGTQGGSQNTHHATTPKTALKHAKQVSQLGSVEGLVNFGAGGGYAPSAKLIKVGNYVAGDEVGLQGTTFEFVEYGAAGAGNIPVIIGADLEASLIVLEEAINALYDAASYPYFAAADTDNLLVYYSADGTSPSAGVVVWSLVGDWAYSLPGSEDVANSLESNQSIAHSIISVVISADMEAAGDFEIVLPFIAGFITIQGFVPGGGTAYVLKAFDNPVESSDVSPVILIEEGGAEKLVEDDLLMISAYGVVEDKIPSADNPVKHTY